MTKLPEIASLWIGERLSWLEQLCLKSFADSGHHVTLYAYSEIENVPAGVHLGDAEDIFPSRPMHRHKRTGSPAIHADIWRLHLLSKTDKVWVDADMYCRQPFNFGSEYVFGWEKPGLVCNAVLGLPRDSDALAQALAFFDDEYAIAPWLKPWQRRELEAAQHEGRPVHITEQDWGFTGPALVTWFLGRTGEIKYAQPQAAFYPVSFKERNHLILRKFDVAPAMSKKTYGVHFWARRVKPRLEEKEGNRPQSGSYLDGLLKKHEVDPAKAPIPTPRLHPDETRRLMAPSYTDALDLLFKSLSSERRMRIVDVGANPLSTPPYADLLARRGCEVIGFEPHAAAFEELQNIKGDLETYLPHAVGDGSDEVLNIYRESGLTSIFKPYEGALSYLGRSRRNIELLEESYLKTVRLDDLPSVPNFDVLKIDAQGAELKVFQGGTSKLAGAMVVISEVRFYQLYEHEPMFGKVDEELRKLGFQLHKFLFTKSKVVPNSQINSLKRQMHRNQLIDGDCVYIRDPGRLDLYSNENLKHLAIAATSLFHSFDLALFCIDELARRGVVSTALAKMYVEKLPDKLKKDPL